MDRIEQGILELISKHQIKRLVMGAAAEKHYKRYGTNNMIDRKLFPHHHACPLIISNGLNCSTTALDIAET
jgi:hypothetical protein